jgi:hypothetical protein
MASTKSNSLPGRNDACPCGSCKKFKRCCGSQKSDGTSSKQVNAQPTIGEMSAHRAKILARGTCLHPRAGKECNKRAIKAHTIPRAQLSEIAQDGHVLGIREAQNEDKPPRYIDLIGINQASTRRAFCQRHDNELFADIEDQPIHYTPQQCCLLGFRAFCQKHFLLRLRPEEERLKLRMRRGVGRVAKELITQTVTKEMAELRCMQSAIDGMKRFNDFVVDKRLVDAIEFYVIEFAHPIELLCADCFIPTHDLTGQELALVKGRAEWLTISFVRGKPYGAVVLTWPNVPDSAMRGFVEFIDQLSEADATNTLLRYVFQESDNIYFSPTWWNSIADSQRRSLVRRINAGDGQVSRKLNLLVNGEHIVDWKVRAKHRSWNQG